MVADDPRFMAETVFEQMFGVEYDPSVGETLVNRESAMQMKTLQDDQNIADMLAQIFDDNCRDQMTHSEIFEHMVNLFDVEDEEGEV